MALHGVMFNNDDIICIIKSDRDSGYSFVKTTRLTTDNRKPKITYELFIYIGIRFRRSSR